MGSGGPWCCLGRFLRTAFPLPPVRFMLLGQPSAFLSGLADNCAIPERPGGVRRLAACATSVLLHLCHTISRHGCIDAACATGSSVQTTNKPDSGKMLSIPGTTDRCTPRPCSKSRILFGQKFECEFIVELLPPVSEGDGTRCPATAPGVELGGCIRALAGKILFLGNECRYRVGTVLEYGVRSMT